MRWKSDPVDISQLLSLKNLNDDQDVNYSFLIVNCWHWKQSKPSFY